MLRKIGLGLFCAGAIFSTNSLAMTQTLMPGLSLEYKLFPNVPLELANVWLGKVTAVCNISGQDTSNDILIEALKKSGTINNEPFVEDSPPKIMTIHPGDQITLTAVAGAKVRLTNQGANTIIANCTVKY